MAYRDLNDSVEGVNLVGTRLRLPSVKRIVDFVCALVLLLPMSFVLLPAAIAIKLTSSGPVLFRQTRYGRNLKPFTIFKLRTMTVEENGDAFRQAVKGDARITRVGTFLRKTSLDELPQILNVLRGDMSFVGPRPHATKHDNEFRTLIPGYERRFRVRPGITGLAQIKGHRGPTETVEAMAKRVKYDVEYTNKASALLDLKILFATVLVVIIGKNAF